jgi:alpha-tubulin suppressor-like RCC1 family protein
MVTEAGAVDSFGIADGRVGQGIGRPDEGVFLPTCIEALDGIDVATVAAGDLHALALTRDGRVYSWGKHGWYSPVHGHGNEDAGADLFEALFADEYVKPHLINALLGKRVRAIAAGIRIACAVTDSGALYTWGDNDSGNLGHRDVRSRNKPK